MRSVKIDLRRYRSSDARGLAAAIDAVCAEGRWMHTARFEPTPAWEYALSHPDDTSHLLLVACHEDEVVGWCRVFPGGEDGSAVVGIGLLKPYRDRGVGTQMLGTAIDWARQQGLQRLVLTTRSDNARAIHVFRKYGFQETGRRDGEWIEMALLL